MHIPVRWRLTWSRSTGLRFCRCIITLNAYMTVSYIQVGSVWGHRAQCTEAGIEVLTVTFGRCDRFRRDDGKCYIWEYDKGNDRELTEKISRNLPWGTEKNHRNVSQDSCHARECQNWVRVRRMTIWTSILCGTTVKLERLCSRTVWFMSAALFLCVWCRMDLSRSNEETRLDVWITGGSFPSQGLEFCATKFVRTCQGPIQPSLW
jgi:hypothetical protein